MPGLYQALSNVQYSHNTRTSDPDIFKSVFEIITNHKGFITENNAYDIKNGGSIFTVGTQGRYLIYLGSETVIPSMLLMVTHQTRSKKNRQGSTNHIKIFFCSTNTNISKNVVEHTCQHEECDEKSTNMLSELKDPTKANKAIVNTMRLFLQRHNVYGNNSNGMNKAKSDGVIMVQVRQADGTVDDLPVLVTSLLTIRNTIRNVGGLAGIDNRYKEIISQNEQYSLSMLVCGGTFKLSLHAMNDMLENPDTDEIEPIVVFSHNFDRLDYIVEEIHMDRVICKTTNEYKNFEVTGMLDVTNAFLRTSIAAASVISMGFDRKLAFYEDMQSSDITKAL